MNKNELQQNIKQLKETLYEEKLRTLIAKVKAAKKPITYLKNKGWDTEWFTNCRIAKNHEPNHVPGQVYGELDYIKKTDVNLFETYQYMQNYEFGYQPIPGATELVQRLEKSDNEMLTHQDRDTLLQMLVDFMWVFSDNFYPGPGEEQNRDMLFWYDDPKRLRWENAGNLPNIILQNKRLRIYTKDKGACEHFVLDIDHISPSPFIDAQVHLRRGWSNESHEMGGYYDKIFPQTIKVNRDALCYIDHILLGVAYDCCLILPKSITETNKYNLRDFIRRNEV